VSRRPGRRLRADDSRRFTLLALHAHPDDEALLTGGTLAKAAAQGHRVVLVTATAGERGLAGDTDGRGAQLAGIRTAELQASAAALGCARVVSLGYADSGLHPDPSDTDAFAHADVEAAAVRLASLLREEHVDVLTTYDRNGGYGHPDHVQVHVVGRRAAELAGTPVVLEATVSAPLLRAALTVLRLLGDALGSSAPLGHRQVFSPRSEITHRVRVHDQLTAKRAAMAAHASQLRGPQGQPRVLDRLLRLPPPLFALAFGTEWYVQSNRPARRRWSDVFDTVPSVGSSSEWPRPIGKARSNRQVSRARASELVRVLLLRRTRAVADHQRHPDGGE
jgi:LmbE family N-acetylglucosaminyl deacetylase